MMTWLFPTAFSSWYRRDDSNLPDEESAEFKAAQRVLRSGRLTMGEQTEAFEHEIAEFHSRKHAVAVNSGSSATEIAMAAIRESYFPNFLDGAHEGPRSASVPSIAWSTTYGPCQRNGYGNFDLRDADDTWNSPLPPLREVGVPRWYWSDAYVACSILGNPLADCDKIAALKVEHPSACPTLEDNCESLGARTADGRLTGTFGDLSTGSGFFSHQLSAIELGWILTDDDELVRLCRLLRNHGNDGWGSEDFERSYSFSVFGYNLRPSEINCAIAREQLKKLDVSNALRRENALLFRALSDRLPIQHQQWTSPHVAPFGLAFECESREARARLVKALRASGVDVRLPTGGSFVQHDYGKPWREANPTPRADQIHERGIFLGVAPWPIPHLIERVVKVMKETL